MKLHNSGLCDYYSENETVVRRYCDARPVTKVDICKGGIQVVPLGCTVEVQGFLPGKF